MDGEIYTLSGGEISVWLDEAGSLMLKITSDYKDPVELGEGELEELIKILTQLRSELTG